MTTIESTPVETPGTVDPEEVAGRVIGILNDGAICLLASLGHELGIFETLAGLPPATSAQVADAAGLDERYVREWLGGMVTAGFVEYDPDGRAYHLCPDHAPFLTGAGPDNLTRTMRFVSLMGLVQPKVVEAFRHGGACRTTTIRGSTTSRPPTARPSRCLAARHDHPAGGDDRPTSGGHHRG